MTGDAQGTELGRGFWAITADLSGLREGLEKGREGVQQAGSTFAKHSQRISTGMMAAGGAIVASMGMAVRSAAAAGDELQVLSGVTGMSTDALQTFRFAGEQTGVELATVNRALERFSPRLTQMIEKAEDGSGTLNRLNIPIKELRAMKPEEQFIFMAEAIGQLGSRAERESVSMELFGTRAGRKMRPMLDEGAAGIAAYSKQMDRLGLRMDEDGIKKASELQGEMDLLSKQVKAVWVEIGMALIPALQQFVPAISSAITSTVKWVKENKGLVQALAAVAGGLFAIGQTMKVVALVKAAISAAYIPYVGWAIALALLGAAGYTSLKAHDLMSGVPDMAAQTPDIPDMGGPAATQQPGQVGGGNQFPGGGATVNVDARGAYIRDESDMERIGRDIGDYAGAQLAMAGG